MDSDDDEVSATSVIDLTDNDLLLSGLTMSVKQEMVNQNPVNHISVGGVYFPGQEMANKDSINHISYEGVDSPREETPRWRSASEWEEQDPQGDVCSVNARQILC